MSESTQTITYGSIISISHIEDGDALIAADGFIKQSVVLKGMSSSMRSNSLSDQLSHVFFNSCLFLVCPKMSNAIKEGTLNKISGDDD
jgi:inositol 1,4,5-triphosphate receptor type 1/inositol 1,4,5-triphosphate receptor type 3